MVNKDTYSRIVVQLPRFEAGELEQDEALVLFQDLVDTGLVWTLQGSYGRAAQALIDSGLILPYPRPTEEDHA